MTDSWPWFSRLGRHLVRKWSRSILATPELTRALATIMCSADAVQLFSVIQKE